jgi:hypothetical protein
MMYYDMYLYAAFMVIGIGFVAFAMLVFFVQAMESSSEQRVVDDDRSGKPSRRLFPAPNRAGGTDDLGRIA